MNGKKNTFFCGECGLPVSRGSSVCPHCGSPFGGVKCPSCGYQGHSLKFVNGCPSCGYHKGASRGMPRWFYRLSLGALILVLGIFLFLLFRRII